MNSNFHQEIFQLAQSQKATKETYRSYFRPFDQSQLGQELYSLACQTRQVQSLTDREILTTFFTAEAADYLFTLPNLFWFWATVRESVLWAAEEDSASLIDIKAVETAVTSLRNDMSPKYNLRKPLTVLSPAQLCARTAIGIVLVKVGPGDLDEIIVNPMFAPNKLGN
jgi:hypothetical protein